MQTNNEFLDSLDWEVFNTPSFWEGESWQKMIDLSLDLWNICQDINQTSTEQ